MQQFDPREFLQDTSTEQTASAPSADPRPEQKQTPAPVDVAPVSAPETTPASEADAPVAPFTPTIPAPPATAEDEKDDLEVPQPPAAPAAVTQDAAPATDTASAADTDDQHDPSIYRRRRVYALAGVAAFITAVALALTVGPLAPHHSPAALSAQQQSSKVLTQDATLDINTIAAGDQKRAAAMLTSKGSLDGFTITASNVRVAASGKAAVISRVHAGACYMYGILDGAPTATQVDASGAACTDTEIAKAQKSLDEQTIALEQVDAETAQSAFTSASDTVMYYASKNFDDAGVPSLTGLPADLGSGVRVVANHGSYVTTQATINGVCKSAELGADGTLGQIINCR